MPFTLAHPAAVLSFRRLPLDFDALVIGSMAPDFPYFWDFAPSNQYGHTLPGIALFCLPVGLAAYGFWTVLQCPTLLWLLPEGHRERLAAAYWEKPVTGPRIWIGVPLSVCLGALTHIAWDSCTHQDGAVVRRLPILSRPIVLGRTFPLYKALQYGSGALGLAALATAYALWYRHAARKPVSMPDGWQTKVPWVWLAICLFAVGFTLFVLVRTPDAMGHRDHAGFAAITALLSGFYTGLTLFSLYRFVHRSGRAQTP